MGELQAIFPTVVAATPLGLNEATRNEIFQYIRDNKDRFKKRARDGVIFEESPKNLHHLPLMETMFLRIADAVKGALGGMGFKANYLNMQITRSWANYNTQKLITGTHSHVNSHLSIVYYPDDSCSQAPINFMKSFNQNEWVPGFADSAYSQISIWDQKILSAAISFSIRRRPTSVLCSRRILHTASHPMKASVPGYQ